MPIPQSKIRQAATSFVKRSNLSESLRHGKKTAFLCHSHKDSELAKGVAALLQVAGWAAYIDWEDQTMPDSPNRETARKIQERIISLSYFLFLATENSMSSRWCPWEIGFADGKKPLESILIIPTTDGFGRFHGNEYLQLYRKIDETTFGELIVSDPNNAGSMVRVASL